MFVARRDMRHDILLCYWYVSHIVVLVHSESHRLSDEYFYCDISIKTNLIISFCNFVFGWLVKKQTF